MIAFIAFIFNVISNLRGFKIIAEKRFISIFICMHVAVCVSGVMSRQVPEELRRS